MSDKEYYLFLDDVRKPEDAANYMSANAASLYRKMWWIVVRNYEQFTDYITRNGMPVCISFDHDLADEHYDTSKWADEEHNFKEKTGYDCAKWLLDYVQGDKSKLPLVLCHSMNPIGKEKILKYLNQ